MSDSEQSRLKQYWRVWLKYEKKTLPWPRIPKASPKKCLHLSLHPQHPLAFLSVFLNLYLLGPSNGVYVFHEDDIDSWRTWNIQNKWTPQKNIQLNKYKTYKYNGDLFIYTFLIPNISPYEFLWYEDRKRSLSP